MATNKKKKRFVQIYFLKENEKRISRKVIRASLFSEEKINDRCCGYRFFRCLAKNGFPYGDREYEEFICKNGASIKSKEDVNAGIIKDMESHKCTHLIWFRNFGYLVDLA